MKKRILSIVLAICLVLSCVPVTVFAANADATELQNKLNSGGTVTLSKDYTIDTTLSVQKAVTLDLNGHVIKMTGSGSVIKVAWGNLTLQDSSPTATHTDASLPSGGVITGGNAVYGGGVRISANGSMTMNGGTIENCSAEYGGGVAADSGPFTMNGGTIKNCTATTSYYTHGGGGVYLSKTYTFTMTGGTIENCSSTTSGGGVFSSGNSSMSGNAIIRGCSAKAGGGVQVYGGTFTMTGGTIEACTSTSGTSDAVRIDSNDSLLANGGIVKGTVLLSNSNSAINTTSTDSYTKFYNEVTNSGTISGGVYYDGIQNKSSGTVSGTYHTVSFDTNGGSSVPTQWFVNTDKEPALQPADPTRENSIFMGWYNGDAKYDFTQPVTSNITLTAKWVTTNVSTEAELKEALNAGVTSIKLVGDFKLSSTLDLTDKKITLDLNGYVLTGNIQLADTSALPQSILTLIDSRPTATHSDSSLPAGGVVKGNITLTSGSGSVSHLYANGGTVTGQTSLPSYAGGIFCTSATPTAFKAYVGNYGEVHGGIFYGSIQENCIKEKTVTFMNGSSRYALEVVANGNKVVAPISTPLKAGYDFEGWYNGDTKYTFGSTLSESITLTAKFSNPKTYNISYDLAGGTATNPGTYTVESEAIILNNPTKTGYTFTGWSGTGLTGVNNMTVTIAKGSTGERTYTAHFSQNNYTVNFDTNGGSSISNKTGVKWTDTVLSGITNPTKDGWEFTGWKCGDKTVNANTKYSDLAANDTVTSVTLVAQWKDITAPTGEISVGTNKWKGFLNTITFGLFFKDTQSVTVTATDDSYTHPGYTDDKAVKVEYLLSDKALSETEVVSATFTSYTDSFSINPDNKYVIYARLTDYAGNVTYISSNGIVLDATVPVITGVTDGAVYYTTQKAVVTDDNLKSVTLNGVSIDGTTVTLDGNTDEVYTVVATDKADNSTIFTVTMKSISSLAQSIEDVNDENVKSSNKEAIDAVKESIGNVDISNATDSEKEALNDINGRCDELLDIIDKAQKATQTENIKNVEGINPDNVTEDDREALDKAKADLEKALEEYGSNYTDDELAKTQSDLERVNESLKVLDDVKAVEDLIAELPDSVEPDDLDTVQSILDANDAYNALTDYEKSLVSEDAKEKLYTLTAGISAYMLYEGSGGIWTIGQDGTLTFTANGAYSKFTGIKVDGKDVDESNYTAESGSTIITLNADYLNTLSVGTHTLTVLYTDGEAEAEFEVKAAPEEATNPSQEDDGKKDDTTAPKADDSMTSPKTDDDSYTALTGAIIFFIGGAVIFILLYSKRKKQNS